MGVIKGDTGSSDHGSYDSIRVSIYRNIQKNRRNSLHQWSDPQMDEAILSS